MIQIDRFIKGNLKIVLLNEMPSLYRSIVEHRLPIKPGYQPFKQALRRVNPNVLDDIKKETERLLETKFIQPC